MWLMTSIGFFSIVQKPADAGDGMLTVRARVREDLEKFAGRLGGAEIHETPDNDYRFRLRAPGASVGALVGQLAQEIDYAKFKSAVASREGRERASLYGQVWHALQPLQQTGQQKGLCNHPADPSIPHADAYGGILFNHRGEVLLREPTHHFGGYAWTFPKGAPEHGETAEEAALREVREETGYGADIVFALPRAYAGTTGKTSAFFVMAPRGEPADHDWETASVRWASVDVARQLICLTAPQRGRERDLAILDDAASAWRARSRHGQ